MRVKFTSERALSREYIEAIRTYLYASKVLSYHSLWWTFVNSQFRKRERERDRDKKK